MAGGGVACGSDAPARLLVGAIVEHGEQLVAETLNATLTTPPRAASAPATVPVPAALQRYRVEATPRPVVTRLPLIVPRYFERLKQQLDAAARGADHPN